MLARYGGEEFCVVIPQTTHDGIAMHGERIRQAVGGSGTQLETANVALYQAKENGRKRVEIAPRSRLLA